MRITHLLVAAALGTTAALTANAAMSSTVSAAPMTRDSGWVRSSAVTPIQTVCASSTSALAHLSAVRTAGRTYKYLTIVNGVTTHSGYATANSYGVVAARTGVANLKTSTVAMRLDNVLVVNGSITPGCGMPAGYVVAPPVSGARGSSTAYTLHKNSNGTVTRWNPCDGVIHVRINPTGGGSYAVNDVLATLAAITAQTGLKFAYDGTTTFIPKSTNSYAYPAALVIAWASRSQTDLLGAGAVGEGGWRSTGTSTDGVHWTWKINKGFVVVDPAAKLTPGFARGISRGALLMHEIGHVMGLGHTSDAAQVMSPTLTSSSYASWGSGDKNGLTQVGATKGCVASA